MVGGAFLAIPEHFLEDSQRNEVIRTIFILGADRPKIFEHWSLCKHSFEYTTMDFLSDLLGQCSDLYGAMVVKADDTIDHITEVDTFVPGEHSYTQPSTHARTPLLLHVTLSQPYRLLG